MSYETGMDSKCNPRQLVLRRDTATGMTLVGWEEDLPVGRFVHIELVCEVAKYILPDPDSEFYDIYQSALDHACQANQLILDQKIQENQSRGWYRVPFELALNQQSLQADRFGNYSDAALQLHYQLARHEKQVWVVIQHGIVVHVRARHPRKPLDELTSQVWQQKQLHELQMLDGSLLEGKLIVCESGLWVEIISEHNNGT